MFKEKLRELLCEVPKIKSDLEELRFGALVDTKKYGIVKMYNLAYFFCEDKFLLHYLYTQSGGFKIIGNPLEEKHLRMYFDSIIGKEVSYCLYNNEVRKYTQETGDIETYITICELDDEKSFDNQSDEFFEKIFNYLSNLR